MSTDLTRVLADCLDRIERTGETLDASLAHYPEQRAELSDLLPIAALLRSAPAVAPSLDFRVNARAHLIARLPARRSQTPIDTLRSMPLRPALARVAIGLLVIVFAGAGAAYAAADSLPNDVFYPVKLTLEQVRLAFAPDDRSQNELRLTYAAERLREVKRLIEAGRSADAIIALDDFGREVRTVVIKAQAAPDATEQLTLYTQLHDALANYESALTEFEDQLPEVALAALQQAHAEIRAALREHAPGLLPADTPVIVPTSTSTRQPTPQPTRSLAPGVQPTLVATLRPTHRPTEVPTWVTPDATYIATYVPTQWGTLNPTLIATLVPTRWRTLVPTAWPTIIPTIWRTYIPTAWPTIVPPVTWPTLPFEPPDSWPTFEPPDDPPGEWPPGWP
ncbi:MAG: hypothetical protein HY870_02550 [Chloroflexi bacterium]|nr:hypothetical protein [Chloroflexota bacterium]